MGQQSRLLQRLTIRERPGRTVFRYWQEGPGFDRNLHKPQDVAIVMEYLHLNPVRRQFCQSATDWRWSSARFYASEGADVDKQLPQISPLPAEFWQAERSA